MRVMIGKGEGETERGADVTLMSAMLTATMLRVMLELWMPLVPAPPPIAVADADVARSVDAVLPPADISPLAPPTLPMPHAGS